VVQVVPEEMETVLGVPVVEELEVTAELGGEDIHRIQRQQAAQVAVVGAGMGKVI
jgi:hypothetical protein